MEAVSLALLLVLSIHEKECLGGGDAFDAGLVLLFDPVLAAILRRIHPDEHWRKRAKSILPHGSAQMPELAGKDTKGKRSLHALTVLNSPQVLCRAPGVLLDLNAMGRAARSPTRKTMIDRARTCMLGRRPAAVFTRDEAPYSPLSP